MGEDYVNQQIRTPDSFVMAMQAIFESVEEGAG